MGYRHYPAGSRMSDTKTFAPAVDFEWTLANGSRAQRRRLLRETNRQANKSNQARRKISK